MKTLLTLLIGLIFGLTLGNTFRSIEAHKSLKRIESKIDAMGLAQPENKP